MAIDFSLLDDEDDYDFFEGKEDDVCSEQYKVLKQHMEQLFAEGMEKAIARRLYLDDGHYDIDMPVFLKNPVNAMCPPVIYDTPIDTTHADSYLKKAAEIVLNGDCPQVAGKSVTKDFLQHDKQRHQSAPGLSARMELRQGVSPYEPIDNDIQYFWMSWLMRHVPVFFVPYKARSRYEGEKSNDILGLYVHNTPFMQPIIFIHPDRIESAVESLNKDGNPITVEQLTIATIIHEFAHAVMDIGWSISGSGVYYYPSTHDHDIKDRNIKEEAWANALMLQYLSAFGDKDLYQHVLDFTHTQKEGYKDGEKYMQKRFSFDPQNWYNWYQTKLAGSKL